MNVWFTFDLRMRLWVEAIIVVRSFRRLLIVDEIGNQLERLSSATCCDSLCL